MTGVAVFVQHEHVLRDRWDLGDFQEGGCLGPQMDLKSTLFETNLSVGISGSCNSYGPYGLQEGCWHSATLPGIFVNVHLAV